MSTLKQSDALALRLPATSSACTWTQRFPSAKGCAGVKLVVDASRVTCPSSLLTT